MKLKTTYLLLLISAGMLLARPSLTQAQPTAHYCPSAEGLDGASVPPPGFYLRDYNMFYTADRLNNAAGKSAGPPIFNVFVYANVPRLVYVTKLKFLGANVGVNTLMPIVDQNVQAGPYKSSTFGAGDLFVDGFLAWHPKPFDFVFGCGAWLPTGDSGAPINVRGYWANMLSFGGTWHIDSAKTWSVSALSRYEINGEQRDTHITPGNAYTLEWGIGKAVFKHLELGVAGYYQDKVTADSGEGAPANFDSVAAIGPEITTVIPKIEVHASLRYEYEFMANNRAQGQAITLTLTKRF